MGPAPRASVVIAAHNGARTLPHALDALEAQGLAEDEFEVIVVDDDSSDGTADLVRGRKWPVLISTGGNIGAPAARNLGVRSSRGEILVFTDADCEPDTSWLSQGLRRFEARPAMQVLGGQIIVPVTESSSVTALVDASRFLDQEGSMKAGSGVSANLWIRRDAFLEVDGFNERLAKLGYPDTELVTLLSGRGATLEYASDVIVNHPARGSYRELGRKAYRLGVGHAPYRRYGRVVSKRHLPLFLRLRRLRPRDMATRDAKLRSRGVTASRWRHREMLCVELFCISLPLVIGDLVGTIRSAIDRSEAPR